MILIIKPLQFLLRLVQFKFIQPEDEYLFIFNYKVSGLGLPTGAGRIWLYSYWFV